MMVETVQEANITFTVTCFPSCRRMGTIKLRDPSLFGNVSLDGKPFFSSHRIRLTIFISMHALFILYYTIQLKYDRKLLKRSKKIMERRE
jgi:hypothetical protein